MMVYVLTMEAVYDHGCAGVFTSREAAESWAEVLYRDSDGHHFFRVDEVPLNESLIPNQRRHGWSRRTPGPMKRKLTEGAIGFVPWASHESVGGHPVR